MINVDTIVLEDGIEYIITKERQDNNNTKYVLLTNINNSDDFCIRKIITENNEEFFVNLDDEKEFIEAFKLFV